MKRLALLLLALTSACAPVTAHSTAPYPILLGPVDRIGGGARVAPRVADVAFEGETQNDFLACLATLYPTVGYTRPTGDGGMHTHASEAYAKVAGDMPLAGYTARLDDVSAGAWVWFLAGCYEHKWWWGGDGHLEVSP